MRSKGQSRPPQESTSSESVLSKRLLSSYDLRSLHGAWRIRDRRPETAGRFHQRHLYLACRAVGEIRPSVKVEAEIAACRLFCKQLETVCADRIGFW